MESSMNPVSPHFTTVDLSKFFNARRAELPEPLRVPSLVEDTTGSTAFNGIPFLLGESEGPAVILLDAEPVTVELEDGLATYIVFLHAVADRVTNYLDGFADFAQDGNELGGHVSSYVFEYEDGSRHETAIRRRFAIQQSRVVWGGSPFETVPAMKATVFNSATEETQLGRVPEHRLRPRRNAHQFRARSDGREDVAICIGEPTSRQADSPPGFAAAQRGVDHLRYQPDEPG